MSAICSRVRKELGKDDESQIQNLKNILMGFELVSGLKVNFRKSTIVGLVQLQNGEICANIFGCTVSQLLINYLGIPLGNKSKCKTVWNEIVQRTHQKFVGWKKTYLSRGQRNFCADILSLIVILSNTYTPKSYTTTFGEGEKLRKGEDL